MSNSFIIKLVNFLWFQTIWWLVVLYQSTFLVLVLGLLIAWLVYSPLRKSDGKIMIAVLLLGTVVDSLLMLTGVFSFERGAWFSGGASHWIVPIWLVCLWAALGGSIQHSLSVFANKPWLAMIGGAVFAPLSYFGGKKFGAVNFGYSPLITLFILTLVWGVVFPVCFLLAKKLSAHDEQD
ncbi:DUF2878 domain-containing protein [Alteromonas lipotrueae]|uniref:DUF2878 domain-containing protein n=1 Tax=Alteromonas lipotrueae TaxID=2803814 RepID=UPI001C4647BF|nr:DUF2878 domain-containing protein [Alteromonas lipotrueae]